MSIVTFRDIESAFDDNYDVIVLPSSSYDTIKLLEFHSTKFILVTGFSDHSMPSLFTNYQYYTTQQSGTNNDKLLPYDAKDMLNGVLNNPYLVAWYTMHCNNPYHPKMHCLPLGINISTTIKNNQIVYNTVGKSLENMMSNIHLENPIIPFPPILGNRPNLLYINMSIENTSYEVYHDLFELRYQIMSYLQHRFPISDKQTYNQYLNDLLSHKFTLSLPGHGIDAYRTWEALMCGSIPVVWSTTINSLYDDLPVIIIEDITMLNAEYLEEQYKIMCRRQYNWKKITSEYWIDIIIGN